MLQGGAKGPGIFFVIPCIDTYKKVDLRTVSFDVPPQEVSKYKCVDLRTVSFDVPPQEVIMETLRCTVPKLLTFLHKKLPENL